MERTLLVDQSKQSIRFSDKAMNGRVIICHKRILLSILGGLVTIAFLSIVGCIEKHPHVLVEARQRGLMMGLKFMDPRCGPWMTAAGFQAGLLTVYANNDPSVIQVLPPLVIQEPEARQVLALLDGMISGLEAAFL